MKEPIAKAVIIDDERPVRQVVRSLLKDMSHISVVGEAVNVPEGLDLIVDQKPDLLLLDIQMPIQTGFELLDELTRRQQYYGVIFISGYTDQALMAVEKAAPHLHVDFVVKPISPAVFRQKVELFYQKWLAEQHGDRTLIADVQVSRFPLSNALPVAELVFQSPTVYHRVDVGEIMYCEAVNRQVNIYGSAVEHLAIPNLTLETLARLLPPELFVRIGKSHILNRNALFYLEKGVRPQCRLRLNGRVREVMLYASNVAKVEELLKRIG